MLACPICEHVKISKECAVLFHLEMRTYVYGIAAMTATNCYDRSEELCAATLTDMYQGLKYKCEDRRSALDG